MASLEDRIATLVTNVKKIAAGVEAMCGVTINHEKRLVQLENLFDVVSLDEEIAQIVGNLTREMVKIEQLIQNLPDESRRKLAYQKLLDLCTLLGVDLVEGRS